MPSFLAALMAACTDAGREPLGVEAEVADHVAGEADGVGLVVDRELRRVAEPVGVAAQDAHARRVERRHPHLLGHRADERRHPVLHLVGGLVGEGDGEDLERADALVADQVGDAVGEHPGLARPGAGHDEQRALGVGDGLGLDGVQPGERTGRGGTVGSLGGVGRSHDLQPIVGVRCDSQEALELRQFAGRCTGRSRFVSSTGRFIPERKEQ